MSRYRLIYICLIVVSSLSQAKGHRGVSDDILIMRGLLYDEYKDYSHSRKMYARLFKHTQEEAYLLKEAKASLLGHTHMHGSIKKLKYWTKKHPKSLKAKRLLIPLYLTVHKTKTAQKEAASLLKYSSDSMDLEIASQPFLYAGKFKQALALLMKVYKDKANEQVLLQIVDIMDRYTHERKQAISLLEAHRRMNISSHDVFAKLLILYSKEKDVDGLIETYKALYEKNENEKILSKIIDGYMYKKDITGAISFLESHNIETELLYELYKSKKMFSEALLFAEKKYKESHDARWLAEKAILLFENAQNKDDKTMIQKVVQTFDKAMELGVDESIYLNYYGYTLIDKDIDIKKGMNIIKNALSQQPENTYYLDSLAWGYYKMNACTKAYNLMKKIVDEEGLKEKEIVTHWRAIKQCK